MTSFIEEQTKKLAEIYNEQVALRYITNINALFLGCLWFYGLLVGMPTVFSLVIFGMFFMNAVFYTSNYLHTNNKSSRIFK